MSNEVATQQQRQLPEIVKFREQLEERASEIKMALPQHITPEKFQRTIISACQSNQELLTANRGSLVLACMKAAQDGLLPDNREAAIVIFKENKKQADGSWQSRLMAQYMPMVYGLRKKILQSGEVITLEVNVVYAAEVEAGKFFYEVGLEPPLRHRPMMNLTEEQTRDSEIVAAYSIATMSDGKKSYEVMRRFEIDRVRETSKTGALRDKKGQKRTPSGPWVDWFAEMAKKTVMRRHSKTLPQSGDIIIDVEGQEQEAGASTAALLATRNEDAPLIEHRPDEDEVPHDKETGEILDQEEMTGEPTKDEPEPEAKKERKPRQPKEKAKPEPEQSAEGNAPQTGEQQDSGPAEEPATTGDAAQSDASESSSDEGDQLGEPDDTINDFEIVADDLISSFKAATTIIDLNAKYEESDETRSQMPEHISSVVESAYQIEKRRLRGDKA